MLLLGIDVGTTSIKAAVFDEDGELRSIAAQESRVDFPRPRWAEQDGERVFEGLRCVVGRAVSGYARDIAAISLSVQGDAVTAVDKDIRPLIPFHLGMDYRCAAQAEAFGAEFGEEALFARTGMRPHPMNSLCKIRWITENMPEIDEKAHLYMTYADFLLARLGAEEPVIDFTMATRTMGLRLADKAWDEELLCAAGISAAQLSRPVPSGTAAGTLRCELAEEWGMGSDVLLVTGGHDQTCAALGAGVVHPGKALDSHGTAEVISTPLPVAEADMRLFSRHFPCYAHAVPGQHFTFSLNHTAGGLLQWYVEEFCGEDREHARKSARDIYDYVLEKAAPSSLYVLPYFNGKGTPDCDLSASGLIAGLRMSTSRYDIAGAVLESLAFDLRENLEALRAADIGIGTLRCVGGGAKSALGLQLKADVTGIPVQTLRVREAACLGAALLAAHGKGMLDDLGQAEDIARVEAVYAPDAAKGARFAERYRVYRELYAANRGLMGRME